MMEKTFWLEIKENDFALPDGHTLDELTRELMRHLASPDPEWRFGVAYSILEQWIREKNLYSNSELEAMVDDLLGYLRNGIGEAGTDSIFLRSVSLWILVFALQRDMNESFLSESKFQDLVNQVEKYVQDEQDLRGWADGKGWAHTAAHIATLLGTIAENSHADKSIHERILTMIADLVMRLTDYVFHHTEDDRLVQTVMIILDKNLVEIAFLKEWLLKLESIMNLASAGMAFDIRVFNAYVNTRNLVRALYFPLELCVPEKPAVWEELRPALQNSIKEIGLC